MSDLPDHSYRVADLPTRKRTQFTIEPDAAGRAAIAEALDLLGLRKLRFDGALVPMGKRDWKLEASLGATVQQACVVTLDPVTTRVDEDIVRIYKHNLEEPDGSEVEVPEDDTPDPLPEVLNLTDVIIEALALTLPPYPRKDDADGSIASFTEPGKTPMTDADARPFAGLAALRDSLENKDNDGD